MVEYQEEGILRKIFDSDLRKGQRLKFKSKRKLRCVSTLEEMPLNREIMCLGFKISMYKIYRKRIPDVYTDNMNFIIQDKASCFTVEALSKIIS